MKIIGLCGGSGAGKTAASEIMSTFGAAVIDTDRVYRDISGAGSECTSELADTFGDGIITKSGELDRAALAKLVYSDGEARAKLNRITHKYIKAETLRRLEVYRSLSFPAAIVDAPLLFESGFDAMCDATVGVIADTQLRVGRIIKRDGISESQARARIAAQLSDDELCRRCGYIIKNNGSADELYQTTARVYNKIITGAAT